MNIKDLWKHIYSPKSLQGFPNILQGFPNILPNLPLLQDIYNMWWFFHNLKNPNLFFYFHLTHPLNTHRKTIFALQ